MIELLVVVAIVAILAAISIPIFVSQREKAARAQVVSALKNASTFMYTAESANGFSGVTVGELLEQGLRYSDSVEMFLASDPNSFCFLARHEDHDITLYLESETGAITESGSADCPAALPESPGGEVPGGEVPGDEGSGGSRGCIRGNKKKC